MGCGASTFATSGKLKATPASSLRGRLVSLGETFSIEVGPGDVHANDGEGKAKSPKLLTLVEEAKAAGERALLRPNCPVYVNMVKPSMSHFNDVADASKALMDIGLDAVPHLPVSRFETVADLHATLHALTATGSTSILLLGGNDLVERSAAGACAFPGGARALLEAELDSVKERGVKRVVLAGHPDGHPGLGWDRAASDALLLEKVSLVLRSGLEAAIATQFCFDARKLVAWLRRMRQQVQLVAQGIEEGEASQLQSTKPLASQDSATKRVPFQIGIPGPTSRKKLERIAKICEVPSLFIGSAFDVIDSNGDGAISLEDLQGSIERLGLARKGSKLHSMYVRHAGADGLLQPDEFAQLLVEDATVSRHSSKYEADRAPAPGAVVMGPSAAVSGATGDRDGSGVVWPEELVLAVAGYCDSEKVRPGEIVLHLFPFGGLPLTFELTRKLLNGTWPPLTAEG